MTTADDPAPAAGIPLEPTSTAGIFRRPGKRGATFIVVIDLGRTADGRRNQRKRSFKTLKEAKDFRTKTLHDLRAGSYVEPSTEPLGLYLDRWCAGRLARGVKESTVWANRQAVGYRYAALRDTPLCRVTADAIERVHADERAKGIAPSTIRYAHQVLTQALADAVRLGKLIANPAKLAKSAPPPRRVVEVWTADEARKFLAATRDDRLYPLYRTILETGMRIGEALALQWSAVDLEARLIRIVRTQTRTVDNRPAIGEPKTGSARRTIVISPELVAVLRAHRRAEVETKLREGPTWNRGDLVFPAPLGGEDSHQTVNRILRVACERAGVKRLSPHQLRHSAATLAIRAGTPVKVVSQRLGHTSVGFTLDLYIHPDIRDQILAAEQLSAVLETPGTQDVTKTGT